MGNSTQTNWKDRTREAKRELVLDAAFAVFGDRGFDLPTMDDIAAEAGYSRRSLYSFYQSKDEIAAALSLRICRTLALGFSQSSEIALIDVVWAYYRLSRENPRLFRIMLGARERSASYSSIGLDDGWAQADAEFLKIFQSRGEPTDKLALAAALGFVDFLFKNETFLSSSDIGQDDESIKSLIGRILTKKGE